MNHREAITEKMQNEGLGEDIIREFLSRVEKVENGETGIVDWNTIGDLDPDTDEVSLDYLRSNIKVDQENIKKLVVIKLNGGLGTSMGLSKAKSLLPIKGKESFLEINFFNFYLRNNTLEVNVKKHS